MVDKKLKRRDKGFKNAGILILVLLISMMFGCAQKNNKAENATNNTKNEQVKNDESADSKSSHYPVTITTYNHEKQPVELVFEKAPEKVVAIYQTPVDIMLALGVGDRLVAAAQLDDPVKSQYTEEFSKVKYFDNTPPKEEIIALEPDFLASWYSLFDAKMYGDIKEWNDKGINTYIWQNAGLKTPNSLENEFEDILNFGKIFDKEEKANEIVNNMKTEIENAKKSVEGKEKVRAIIFEINKEGVVRVYGKDSIGGDIATQAGADLVVDKNGNIGKEDLINANPDVMFTVYYGDAIVKDQALERVLGDTSLLSIDAIKNKRVYAIPLSEVYASGIRTQDGIKSIIAGLYPDLNK